MDNELADIINFIGSIPPFDHLSQEGVVQLTRAIDICYLNVGEKLPPNMHDNCIYIVRKGMLVYQNQQGGLIGKYGEGDICTVFCSAYQDEVISVETGEDTLLYAINYLELVAIAKNDVVTNFFEQSAEQRLQQKVSKVNEEAVLASSLMNTDISQFYHSPVATIEQSASIQRAAQQMTELGHSSLVVVEKPQSTAPVGIVTDKDIRRRCVAKGLSFDSPVSDIMTANMLSITSDARAYDALMLMTAKRIHHLPVLKHGQLHAMVTITDLMNHESQNAVNITHLIRKASSIAALKDISSMLPKLQVRMAKIGTTADHVGKSISAITSAFTIRLIELAEQKLGKAPVPYAWLAAGSQARQEQFAHSDQDNALIISDTMKPEHDTWFAEFAKFVSDGLAECGFIFCPGDIMATNKQWRQPQKMWHQYFAAWVDTPSPLALLNASVFFDLTTVHGDESLLNEVRTKMLAKTKGNTLFLAHLSKNALLNRPPLGFFRDFVLSKNGENEKILNIKENGIALIVDLARIYALAEGINSVNTLERLTQVAGTRSLTKASANSLTDALAFLSLLRMNHQASRIKTEQAPNNELPITSISRLEREHLKDAFKVIKTLQDARQTSYS